MQHLSTALFYVVLNVKYIPSGKAGEAIFYLLCCATIISLLAFFEESKKNKM